MSNENLPLEEEANEMPTPPKGNGTEDETPDDFSWLDGESEEDMVYRINRETGKQYRTIDDVVKSIKESNRLFTQEGRRKKEETVIVPTPDNNNTPAIGVSDLEVMFYESRPEAERVKSDLEAIAKAKGVSVIQAWKNETWLHEKANSLVKEEQRRNDSLRKPIQPTGAAAIQANNYADMSYEDILKLPPEEAEKAIKAKSSRS